MPAPYTPGHDIGHRVFFRQGTPAGTNPSKPVYGRVENVKFGHDTTTYDIRVEETGMLELDVPASAVDADNT